MIPNKLLTRRSILLVQIKAGNNSYKFKNKIRQIPIFCISTKKLLKTSQQYNQVINNDGIKYDSAKRSPKILF